MGGLPQLALALLLALAALGPLASHAEAQYAASAGVRSPRDRLGRVTASPTALVAPWSARRSKAPYLWGGALLGGAAAGVAHVVYIRQLPKGEYNDLGYFLVPGSVLVGGALGAGAGYLVYRVVGR